MDKLNPSEITKKIKDFFLLRPEIKLAYLFGSLIAKKTNKYSDIDIAILIDTYITDSKVFPYGYKAELLTDLIKLLKTNNVDLVILNNAPSLLKHRVISRGRLIFSRDEEARVRMQIKTVNEYNDIKYLLAVHKG